jgi:hypothetical protein
MRSVAHDLLFEDGQVAITPGAFGGYRRSSFIGAVLLTLHAVDADTITSPTVVRLQSESPLRTSYCERANSSASPASAMGA